MNHGLPALWAGLRLLECCRLRIKDVDFARSEITVRDGKGNKDRVTLLPGRAVAPLVAHIEKVRQRHAEDLRRGEGSVDFSSGDRAKVPQGPVGVELAVGIPGNPALLGFLVGEEAQASSSRVGVAENGAPGSVPGANCEAGKLSFAASFSCDTFAGGWVQHPDDSGASGHSDVSTTMIYTYVLNRGGRGVRSLLDSGV